MSLPLYSDLDMLGNTIVNIKPPTTNDDLVNKEYVDTTCTNISNDILNTMNTIEYNLVNLIEDIQSNLVNLETDIPNIIINSIVDDLDTPVENKSLSARQGYILNMTLASIDSDINILQNRVSNLYEDLISDTPEMIGSYLNNDRYRFVKTINIDNASSGFVTVNLFENIPDINSSTELEIVDIKGMYKDNDIVLGYKRKLGYSDSVSTINISKDISIGLISNNRDVDLLFGGYWIQEGTVNITADLIVEYYIVPPANPILPDNPE